MFKQHLDQNYDFKKLLGALINPLSAKDVYTRFEPENEHIDKNVKIKAFTVVLRPNEGMHRVQH